VVKKNEDGVGAQVNLNYARMLLKLGKLETALAQAKVASGKNEHSADAHGRIGLIYAKQKKCGKARSELDRALSIDKGNKDAKKGKKLCK
jgi:Tfp pilus assembly protein PilF